MTSKTTTANITNSKFRFFIPVLLSLLFFAVSVDASNNPETKKAATSATAGSEALPATNRTDRTILPPAYDRMNQLQQEKDSVVIKPDKMPEFPGGVPAMLEFIKENVKYPKNARKEKVQGRVIITFIIGKDGWPKDFKIVRSVRHDLDEEALRVVKSMPKWTPGEQDGKLVRVKYTVPIVFRL